MLEIKNISKTYVTGELVQKALDHVSLSFRDNEFVAILGQSGSGKTTMLNIIGGLDRYDEGDLIINNISTKKYKDRDWDSYRNHSIGFVFQSYNLISHQSILSNVELALTLSGISKSVRRQKAKEALEKVGLKEHMHKKPNQLSGGQMQRVAIARALINDPDILLADEPTGALDSKTSIQVMELLKEVAKEKLVIMVTHNPELAESYATRIVSLKDGCIIDDSNPFVIDEQKDYHHENMGKSSMSFLTALTLSFNNLKTKKARTLLTAFAGSIGIIGIALILSLSNGVNTYINDIQKETMSAYPITIEKQTIDFMSIMNQGRDKGEESLELNHELDGVYSNGMLLEMASSVTNSLSTNNLSDFKTYLDNKTNDIHNYIGDNGIHYSYKTKFDLYSYDPDDKLLNADGSDLLESKTFTNDSPMAKMNNASMQYSELMSNPKGDDISDVIKDNYDLVSGNWPKAYNEVVLVLNAHHELDATVLYELGYLESEEYNQYIKDIDDGKEVTLKQRKLSYSDIMNKTFYMIPECDYYVKDEFGLYSDIRDDQEQLDKLIKDAVEVKVSGIIRVKEDANNATLSSPIGYTKALTQYLIDYTLDSDVVKAQKADQDTNVVSGMKFSPKDDEAKIEDATRYLSYLTVSEKANFMKQIMMANPAYSSSLSMMNEVQLASMMDNYLLNPDKDMMLQMYDTYISSGSYDDNMDKFGVVDYDIPESIHIYCDSFEDKEMISECIENYNHDKKEEDQIKYTDIVGLMTSSMTTIIDVISYVLIAFVAVSLIVSSIMIGIITYISVMERTKEIGILRAIGASKKNISQVFNAETFIIGLLSGVLGIAVTLGLLIPINMVIHELTGLTTVNAALPLVSAIVLIILSVILTLIGGFIPAINAAKKDPVTALRSE